MGNHSIIKPLLEAVRTNNNTSTCEGTSLGKRTFSQSVGHPSAATASWPLMPELALSSAAPESVPSAAVSTGPASVELEPVTSSDTPKVTLKDSQNPLVKEHLIYNGTETVLGSDGKKVKQKVLLTIEDTDEFHSKLEENRKQHERKLVKEKKKKGGKTKSVRQMKKESDKVASGAAKTVSKDMLAKLNAIKTDKSENPQWVEEQSALLLLVEGVWDDIEEAYGIASARKYWTRFIDGDEQGLFGAILAANVGDEKLIDAIMALRKLDLISIDRLAEFEKDYRKLENLFLYVGYNYWSTAPAKIVGAAVRIKKEYDGVVPNNPQDLLSFYGIWSEDYDDP